MTIAACRKGQESNPAYADLNRVIIAGIRAGVGLTSIAVKCKAVGVLCAEPQSNTPTVHGLFAKDDLPKLRDGFGGKGKTVDVGWGIPWVRRAASYILSPDPFSLFRGENPTAAAAGFHHPGHNSGFGRVEGAVQAFDTRDFCEIHGAHDLATLNHRLRLSRMVRAAANAQATRPGAGKAIYREKKCRRGTCVLRNLQSGHAVSHVVTNSVETQNVLPSAPPSIH
ncbi:hypothetical protein EDD16DRAFT_1527857 [Pisolithus croceorrhizus]|nr:hypothetical protein EDD16DRAFT_1527857 [Pisolithus croceorrhizus]KAI6108478.1 hypothetical protein EV401DRAFT_1891843 [Pisolithus croceorrhizus]